MLVLALVAGACANADDSPQDTYARAVAAFEQGRPRTARIELMNVLQDDPEHQAARLMQARVHLALEDGIAAESEIARARESGVPAAKTRHLMAHAKLLQGEPREALKEAEAAGDDHVAYVARVRGRALLALGDTEDALAQFERALEAAPDDPETWVDIARLRRSGGNLAATLQAADRAVAADPRHVGALVLRGEMTRSQYGLQAALPWFDRALEIDPGSVPALLERATTYGDLGRMRDMLADTRRVLALGNDHPLAYYLQAVLAARARNFDLAHSLYQRTGGRLESLPSAMLLASAIDLQTGDGIGAAKRLERLVEWQPNNVKARRLLAAAQWRQEDAAAVVRTLQPITEQPDADSYSLSLAGRALQRLGQGEAASAYFARAAAPRPNTAAAFSPQVSDRDLAQMRSAAASQPNDSPAQASLINALLGRGLGREALDRARRLQASRPGAPDPHILAGDALGVLGNFRAAAEEYRKAANIAFTEPVAMRLSEALQRAGDRKAADGVLQLFLEQNPRNVPAQVLLAGRHMQTGNWAEAIPLYEKLRRRLGSRDATILNNLAWAYSEIGDYDQAIPLARRAWELDRDNPATTDTLGWILFKSGTERAEGLALLQRAARG